MIFSCLSWISDIYQEIFRRPQRLSEPLPTDIIADILSRLPVECVQECRRVCKEWNSLISTSSFIQMHLNRATPTIIIRKWSVRHESGLYFINELGDITTKKKPRTRKISRDRILQFLEQWTLLRFSYNGLLVFEPLPSATLRTGMIFNPFTHDKVWLNNFSGEICGVFFHPIAREYRVLWLALREKHVEFKLFSLETRSRGRRLSNCTSRPMNGSPPVDLYGALHWMSIKSYGDDGKWHYPPCSKSIIIFSIVKEEFHVMPHPGDVTKCRHTHLQLLNLKGNLSLCHVLKRLGLLEIWILEDYANWLWAKRHVIDLELDILSKQVPNIKRYLRVRALGVRDGELVLDFREQGVFSYHLQRKTIKKYIFEKEKPGQVSFTVCLHTRSLFPLRMFTSSICFSDD